ncbi:MAG TPA: aminopeptidase [Gemmatimonadales bacterium]|nr:aminopeptidase [Gemmatimonadales bacterium]
MTRRGCLVVFVAIVALLMAGYGTAYLASDEVRFLSRAGAEEFRILSGRRPIADLVDDARVPAERRALLRLVLAVRDDAERLGLEAGNTYRQYSDVGRDTLLLVLSASPPDCLCPHVWKYPIVGRVPYKGYFDPAQAERAAREFEARGYDTWLRPSGAFSTLGWFEDPLLSTALHPDSVELAATVFHEIAHNTLYVRSATPFNESFAQLAGYRAAEAFFRDRGDSALARRAADRWHDEVRLGAYYDSLAGRLERLYASGPDAAALAAGRAEVAAWAREEVTARVAPEMRTLRLQASDRPVNNARIIAARLYRTRLDLFEAWYQREGADVRRAVAALRTLVADAEGEAAFGRLEAALGGPTSGGP